MTASLPQDSITAGSTFITGGNGDQIEAYLAQPAEASGIGSVVVIHHLPGYDIQTKEIVRRFATLGFAAICPNLYWRLAPGADPDDAAATARAQGGIGDEQLVADVRGAADHLAALPNTNGKVGTIGFCSGGRQSVLAAAHLPLAAAVDCYGAFVVGTPPEGFVLRVGPLYDVLPDISCPVLGMFGNEDSYPSPEQVDELDGLLTQHGVEHEFHRYDDAGHAFFAVNRPSYRPAAATDGWKKIEAFYNKHLSA